MNRKFGLDVIGIVAIVIMIIGCGLVIWESKKCNDPFGNMLKPYLEDKNITEYDLVEINVYTNYNDTIAVETITLFSARPYKNPSNDIYHRTYNLSELNTS